MNVQAMDDSNSLRDGRCPRLGAGCQEVLDGGEVSTVAISFQLVIDWEDPGRLSRFWAAALGYELEPPPAGFAT